MQDIDLLLLFQPSMAFGASLAALLYWWRSRGIRGVVLLLSAASYWGAIAAKEAVSYELVGRASSAYGYQSIEVALLLGLQTVFLEVGLSYLLALYGARRKALRFPDAVPYGLGLSFWENGVLLGVLPVFNLGVLYLLLLTPSPVSSLVYQQLQASSPGLFLPPAALLPGALLGTLERVSSMLAHVSWGILVVLAAVTGKKRYLAFALPMGLVDALVPFAAGNVYLFEGSVFLLSLGFLLVALRSLSAAKAETNKATPFDGAQAPPSA